jgi:hypothetical protein
MNILIIFLIIIGVLGILHIYQGYTEAFSMLNHGVYPVSQDNLMLECLYPKNKIPLTERIMNSEKSKQIFHDTLVPMSSYEQRTNNKRYWNNPDNGSCVGFDVCGFYDNMAINKQYPSTLEIPSFSSNKKRVNIQETM